MALIATQVKRRRGTTAENDAFTGAEGEITVDTLTHELRVHDGTTAGGHKIATKASFATVARTGSYNDLLNKPTIPTNVSALTNDANYQTATQLNSAISTHNSSNSAHSDIRSEVAGKQNTISDLATIRTGAGLGATALQPANVINDLEHTDTNKPLSANMGKTLNDRIDAINSLGRYLTVWNATTGLPKTEPTEIPYTYKTGDFFIVGEIGTTNYKPSGTSYTGVASTVVETNAIKTDDVYWFDGTNWTLLSRQQQIVGFSSLTGSPYDNSNLSGALNEKQATISDLATIRSGASAGATAVQPGALATVATSGNYNDLSNKPTIPTVPTNVSAFTNDSNYQTASDVTTTINNKFQLVNELPASPVAGTWYAIPE